MCLPRLRLSAGGLGTRHRAIEALSTRVPVRRLRLAPVAVYSPWQRRRQKRTEEGRRRYDGSWAGCEAILLGSRRRPCSGRRVRSRPLRAIVDNPDEYAGGDEGQRCNEENE